LHALCSSLYLAALTQTTWLAKVSQLYFEVTLLLFIIRHHHNCTTPTLKISPCSTTPDRTLLALQARNLVARVALEAVVVRRRALASQQELACNSQLAVSAGVCDPPSALRQQLHQRPPIERY
jgi:hypothetical protein